MSIITPPTIEKIKGKNNDYTQIEFIPDISKFGIESGDNENIIPQTIQLMKTRVHDLAGCLDSLNVYLNGVLLPSGFQKYVEAYIPSNPQNFQETEEKSADESGEVTEEEVVEKKDFIYMRINDRWQIAVAPTSQKFTQVSWVNSINTFRGGNHVQYISDQIVNAVSAYMIKKDKSLSTFANLTLLIKQHLFLFISCLIENPTFSSQTKETLTTKQKDFGSTCELPQRFLNKLITETNLVPMVLQQIKHKQNYELNKGKGKNSKMKSQLQIPKLDDAHYAGTKRSSQCTLILTEGDSAKALAIAGLSVIGREYFGVFPLKGKIMNVRDVKATQINSNTEISNLVTILGLKYNESYENMNENHWPLRYGKVMIMTDQDHDGSHIKGLLINLFHYLWPNLLKTNFLTYFITPIIKSTQPSKEITFYSIPEYQIWKESILKQAGGPELLKKWRIKYYKGLGTNTSQEAKQYFTAIKKNQKQLIWDNESESSILLGFSKRQAENRKKWLLEKHRGDIFIDNSKKNITFTEFINEELILFSASDNIRSIPSLVDGLKPSQRKVLYSCFKKKLNYEIKVSQLSGYISEQTNYHHGEVSLHNSIISLAQDFVGMNNIPFLLPIGQFGTRLEGGQDHASPRYIFTQLNPMMRLIFPEMDDPLLNYINDDGFLVEPEYYIPIIPSILLNGANGIGTGWSTSIPNYNPIQIIDNVLRCLYKQPMEPMLPYFKYFRGSINLVGEFQCITRGTFNILAPNKIEITELPVYKWTNSYKEWLDKMLNDAPFGLKSYQALYSEKDVKFILEFKEDSKVIQQLSSDSIYKTLGLESTFSLNNIHLFDADGKIKKYDSPLDIIAEFMPLRENLYNKRKQHQLSLLNREYQILFNKQVFCSKVVEGSIKLFNRNKADIIQDIVSYNLPPLLTSKSADQPSYDYLLNIPVHAFSKERLDALLNQCSQIQQEIVKWQNATIESIWEAELLTLRSAIDPEFYK